MKHLKTIKAFLKKHWKVVAIVTLVILWVGTVFVDSYFNRQRAEFEKQNAEISELEKKKQVYDKLVELKAKQDAERIPTDNPVEQVEEYNSMNPDPYTLAKRQEAIEQYNQELAEKSDKKCDKHIDKLEKIMDDGLEEMEEKRDKAIDNLYNQCSSEGYNKSQCNEILGDTFDKLESGYQKITGDFRKKSVKQIDEIKQRCKDRAEQITIGKTE